MKWGRFLAILAHVPWPRAQPPGQWSSTWAKSLPKARFYALWE